MLKVPAQQTNTTAADSACESVPQTVQSLASSCRDADVAASLRYLPASQDVQADKEDVLYSPAEHTEQVYENRDPEKEP